MADCITVNKVKFTHQTIYDGPDNIVHCHFCGRKWPSKKEADLEIHGDGTYPGQEFYHANNEAVRRTEENWKKRKHPLES